MVAIIKSYLLDDGSTTANRADARLTLKAVAVVAKILNHEKLYSLRNTYLLFGSYSSDYSKIPKQHVMTCSSFRFIYDKKLFLLDNSESISIFSKAQYRKMRPKGERR
jgi:hypothetical protein